MESCIPDLQLNLIFTGHFLGTTISLKNSVVFWTIIFQIFAFWDHLPFATNCLKGAMTVKLRLNCIILCCIVFVMYKWYNCIITFEVLLYGFKLYYVKFFSLMLCIGVILQTILQVPVLISVLYTGSWFAYTMVKQIKSKFEKMLSKRVKF